MPLSHPHFLGTFSSQIGRKDSKKKEENDKRLEKYPNLMEPTRLKSMAGKKFTIIASGPAACHTVIVDTTGRAYSWGRNDCGQLGHGDKVVRNEPTLIAGLADHKIVAASCGKSHTVVVTSTGSAYAFGANKHGQLGLGNLKNEFVLTPSPCAVITDCTDVKCGAEFSMWLCQGGSLYSAGLPEKGVLGHGTDHAYNSSDAKIKIVYEPQPTPARILGPLAEKVICQVACGYNHVVCVTQEGLCFSWGSGDYGKLGHREQKDELRPRPIEALAKGYTAAPDSLIALGRESSLITTQPGGCLFSWGKLKPNGDNKMYPQYDEQLAGWTLRELVTGAATYACSAETSTVTWGHAQNGELGYGATGKKSSTKPELVNSLMGLKTHRIAMGVAHTVFLVEGTDEQLAKFPVFESTVTFEEEKERALEKEAADKNGPGASSKAGAAKKRSGSAAAGGGAAKKGKK